MTDPFVTDLQLPEFIYDLNSGPLPLQSLSSPIEKGNCRLAVQLYFHTVHGVYFSPEDILCPKSFRQTGTLVALAPETGATWPAVIRPGDVIFAERIRGKNGEPVDRSRRAFPDEDTWITYLHSAVFIGLTEKNPRIWHATAVSGRTCIWDTEVFDQYYKWVAIRRFQPCP